jgi:hypothetical protein
LDLFRDIFVAKLYIHWACALRVLACKLFQ